MGFFEDDANDKKIEIIRAVPFLFFILFSDKRNKS